MAQTHYKLPIDDEVDRDILDWINSFHRTKKGEMVRHAIRYYMAELEEGEAIKFPSSSNARREKTRVNTQSSINKRERKKPNLNSNALK
jgi:hypothetical protein